jgi:hypothetical protein
VEKIMQFVSQSPLVFALFFFADFPQDKQRFIDEYKTAYMQTAAVWKYRLWRGRPDPKASWETYQDTN